MTSGPDDLAPGDTADVTCDVAVVGDGPAGSALAAACRAAGLDVVLVGPDLPWTSILAVWADELPADLARAIPAAAAIDVVTRDRRRLDRRYGVLDLELLRRALRSPLGGGRHCVGTAERVWHTTGGSHLTLADGGVVTARLVLDATGGPSVLRPAARPPRSPAGWQTAYGLVLDERPAALDGDAAVLMDWRQPPLDGPATFLYVLPLRAGRWLVEETSLREDHPVPAEVLRARLAARLDADLTDRAEHVEHVRIPMPPGVPSRLDPVVGFGAAARYVHPATGYSVAASLRAAPRVAEAIAAVLATDASPAERSLSAWNAVWPPALRRTRALHDVGARALSRFATDDLVGFFEAFFSLPTADWSAYLRIDADPSAVAAVMGRVFSSVPWAMRRRLAVSLPVPLLRRR